MAYTTQQAVDTLNGYLGISEERKEYIEDTKNRGFVLTLDSGEKIVIFIYPLVHKQDNTKNYFDTRDSGAYERGVAWKYALKHGMKYFCFGVNNQVDKFNDYVFSLECNETIIEKISGTKNGSRNGPGNQIIIPNDYIPSDMFERIKNRLGIYISAVRKDGLYEYLKLYDNRPYLSKDIDIDVEVEDPEERNKRLFRYWMGLQVKPEGDSDAGNPYSSSSIDQYVSNVANTPLSSMPDKSVFYTTNIGDVETTIEVLDNSEKKNNTQRSALKKYLEYLKNLVSDEDCEEVFTHSLFGIHIKEKNNALSDDNPHVCIGWSDMGDLSGISDKGALATLYDEHFEKNSRGRGQDIGQVWRFLNDVKEGDYIIYAENSVFHIGRIESEYYYDETEYPDQSSDYKNTRKVRWLKKNISRSVLSSDLHNSLKTAMSIWSLNDYKSPVSDLLRGTYQKDDDRIEEEDENMELVFNTDIKTKYERNRIVFGAPGTGKSYGLKDDCEKLMEDTTGTYERVTFHPDYTYSQFVGTYKPVMDEYGNSIRYDFVPGPFMRVYVEALKSGRTDTPQPHLLLIEEINRAKVAAVFGDVFQLLDRDDDGVSEYEIQASEDIRRYLAKELGGNADNYKKIRIPNNMFIWATMNSADQGVFPMDTAFKRRWNFEYLGINENEEKIKGIGKIMLPGCDEPIEWNTLRKAINDKMSSSDFKINEDKLMGPFFLSKKVIASDENGMIIDTDRFIDAFKSKVIMYLYEDAVKQGKHRFFEGCDSSKYSSVCEAFDEKGTAIFGPTFRETFYDKQRNDA
ncbi:MAG: AAA family ATPase [Agathobacter sp.]|nr:AAA family ATPase [Agathobacter sp.]